MIFVIPGTFNAFVGDERIAKQAGYVAVSEQDYADLIKGKKKWKYAHLVDNDEYVDMSEQRAIEAQICEIKEQLASTDYQAIKHSEGWISDEEYADMKAQRQAWREAIGSLESQLS